MPTRLAPELRFWDKVAIAGPNDCWLWTAGIDTAGYGQFHLQKKKSTHAHRFAWIITNGPIANREIKVLHNCPTGDNMLCCNPAHLFLGSQPENIMDMAQKFRHGHGQFESAEDIILARRLRREGCSKHTIKDYFGVSWGAVHSLLKGVNYTHVKGG